VLVRRSMLRVPAALASALLVAAGIADAGGWSVCVHHGSAMAHAGPAAADDAGHSAHAGHAPHTMPTSPDEGTTGDAEGLCRILCAVAAAPSPVEARPMVVADAEIPTQIDAVRGDANEGILRPIHLPFVLPLSHAPPTPA
jgi:hypothetical protein